MRVVELWTLEKERGYKIMADGEGGEGDCAQLYVYGCVRLPFNFRAGQRIEKWALDGTAADGAGAGK